jgi:hypothetical protein
MFPRFTFFLLVFLSLQVEGAPLSTPAGSLPTDSDPGTAIVSIRVGEPLRSALDRYAAAGLNVVSTTRLISSRLQVTHLPDANASLEAQIRSLLLPHGLNIVLIDEHNAFVEPASSTVLVQPKAIIEVKDPEIEEIIVTSHYRVRRNTSQNNTIDQQDLQTMPSLGRDTLRSLDALPGIASSGVSARHQFRGGNVDEVLYRLDGIELLEPFHLPNVQDLFSAINLNIIESADVYVAGFPVTLGSRMSGVVDLELIEPTEEIAGSVDINLITAAADAHGWIGDWSWLVSARKSLVDKALDQFESDYGTPHFHDELVRLMHTTADHTFVASILNSGDHVTVLDSGETGRSNNDYQAAWLRWEQNHSSKLRSTWQVTNISIENDRRGDVFIPANSVGTLLENREFSNLELSNSWSWQLANRWDLDAGWSVAFQDGEFMASLNALYGPLALPIQTSTQTHRTTSIDRSGESTLAYFSVTNEITDRLTVEAGVRFDGQDIDPVHVNELSTRANIEFQASARWKFSLNVGRYTQQQHLYEIQIDDGKAELDPPQHSDQVNLTSIWAPSDSTRLRVDFYHREIDDPWSHFENLYNRWVLLPELHGDRYEIAPSSATAQGAEATLTLNPSEALSWNVQYAYAQAREKYLGKTHDRPWDQKHSVKAGLAWHNEKWRLGLSATYRSGWPTTPLIQTSAELANAVYQDRLPRYFTLDGHVSRIFSVPHGSLEVYLDVINLSNRKNVGGYDYNTFNDREAQSLLPLLPTFGVLWQW